MTDNSDLRKAIYEQDCDSYRYQDQKKWGRFRTAATVEGVILYGLYGQGVHIMLEEKRLLLIFGTLLLAIIFLVALKDQADADKHMKRIKDYEIEFPFTPGFPLGRHLMTLAMALILILPIYLFIVSPL